MIEIPIKRREPVMRWTPVSERLPEEGVQVLVTDDAGGLATIDVDCGYFDEEYGRFEWFHSQNVTAWMPLPEPYKEKRMTILLNKSSEVEDVREMPNSEIEKYIQLAYKRESNRQILRERLIESKTYRDIIEKHWFFPAGDMMDEKAKRVICAWINEIQRMETKFYRIVRRNRRTEAVERRRGC